MPYEGIGPERGGLDSRGVSLCNVWRSQERLIVHARPR